MRGIDTSSQVSQSTNRTCITHELTRRLWFNSNTWFDLGGKKKHGGLSCSKKTLSGDTTKISVRAKKLQKVNGSDYADLAFHLHNQTYIYHAESFFYLRCPQLSRSEVPPYESIHNSHNNYSKQAAFHDSGNCTSEK